MVNAQEWLDKNYPKERRENITSLEFEKPSQVFNFSEKKIPQLEGKLDLRDFINLKELTICSNFINYLDVSNNTKLTKLICSNNELTTLNLGNCPNLIELDCDGNHLNNTSFIKRLSHPEELIVLSIGNNNFASETIDFLGRFINLEKLHIGNIMESKLQGYNHFYGSLEPLKGLTKLYHLSISNTDIDSGIEYLPDSLKKIFCNSYPLFDSKVKSIYQLLKSKEGIIGKEKHGCYIKFFPGRIKILKGEISADKQHLILEEQLKQKEAELVEIEEKRVKIKNEIEELKLTLHDKKQVIPQEQIKVLDKQEQLNRLKENLEKKLKSDYQKKSIETLLTNLTQIVSIEDSNAEKNGYMARHWFRVTKETLIKEDLSEEDIDNLCQLKREIMKLEKQLAEFQLQQYENQIEIPPKK